MGQITPVGRMKTGPDGKIHLSRKELRQRDIDVTELAIGQTMLAVCGYIMDEPEFDFDDDRIASLWKGVERYIQTVNDPNSNFKMKDLAKVVEKHTGIRVVW